MLGRSEHALPRVTARARLDLALREGVRSVARRALLVAIRDRRGADMLLALELVVTARASRRRRGLRFVDRVAIATTLRARMLGLLPLVAALAALRLERRRAVGTMAVTALLVGVRADRGVLALRLIVTADTAGRRDLEVGAEAVAIAAAGRPHGAERIDRVEGRSHLGVTALAELRRRRLEGTVVTLATRDLADVHRMTRAVADHAPRRGHLFGGAVLARRARRHDQREDEEPHRDPIG